ncbi:MAG TPA: nucleoside hydrolase [Acidobacteriaceae bacterium]
MNIRYIRALQTAVALASCALPLVAQTPLPSPQKLVIFDTDIGDDVDDAFALGLLLSSPDVKLAGITTGWGDTTLRAALTQRFLCETGREEIPVFAGRKTTPRPDAPFTQRLWASNFGGPQQSWPDAISFALDTIRKNPSAVTLISVSPLSNIGAMIDKDPETFRRLKSVVIMGGSIRAGYGDLGYAPAHGIDSEYNIRLDPVSAQKLFASGVPLYVMPLDSTQLKFDEVKRNAFFNQDTPLINTMMELYHQWTASTRDPTPTFYDVVAIAQAIDPAVCPTQPIHIEVDKDGYTRETPGAPNANVCMKVDSERFFSMYFDQLLSPQAKALHPGRTCRSSTAGATIGSTH